MVTGLIVPSVGHHATGMAVQRVPWFPKGREYNGPPLGKLLGGVCVCSLCFSIRVPRKPYLCLTVYDRVISEAQDLNSLSFWLSLSSAMIIGFCYHYH